MRVLLKVSGEYLSAGENPVDKGCMRRLCNKIVRLHQEDWEVGLVNGAGNWLRGRSTSTLDKVVVDQMGMLATVMNGMALQSVLAECNTDAVLYSAFPVQGACLWHYQEVRKALDQGQIPLFVGGTGNPFFTTDSAAALRAIQIHADCLVKITTVNGVYDSDPAHNPDARKFDSLSYDEVIQRRLAIMDATAFFLCREHKMPIQVMSLEADDAIENLVAGNPVGTRIN